MLNVIRKNNIYHWPASSRNTSQEFENEARKTQKLEGQKSKVFQLKIFSTNITITRESLTKIPESKWTTVDMKNRQHGVTMSCRRI